MALLPLRHHFTRFIAALTCFGSLAELTASQVVWFSRASSVHQTSLGAALDGSFTFELGAFAAGFTPTSGNTAQWAANWTTASRSPYQTQTQVFGGTHEVESNGAPFETTNRGYIWGFSTASPTEWILIGDPSWLWPQADDPIAFPKQWTVASAGSVMIGQVDTANGGPFFLRMGQVTGGTLPLVPPTDWLESHFTAAELADAAISGWQADPDLDTLSNLTEMGLGTDPQKADSLRLPSGKMEEIDGQDYLQLTFQKSPSVQANYIVEVSFDQRNWNAGDAFTQDLVDTPNQLVVRSSIPMSVLDQQFMRLVVQID